MLLLDAALIFLAADPGGQAPSVSSATQSSTIAGAAAQIKRCYRSPRIGSSARQITTRLRVRYTIDGMLAEMPSVLDQRGVTPGTRPFADRMAEAAILAVIRCAPLRLPPDHFEGGWDEFELTFSPAAAA